jgi:hypothetical protein
MTEKKLKAENGAVSTDLSSGLAGMRHGVWEEYL